MSLHSDLTFCRADEDHTTYWIGVCECGWRGGEHPSIGEGPDGARREYRQHVEEALGAEAYYDAPAHCRNCGSRHHQGVLIGTHVTSAVCVRCETRMLQPDNEAWHEMRTTIWGQ